jgi:vacuolar protein sorting-associated protein 13A/C
VLDAGHISAESDLVPKSATREIQMKRKKQYTDEDFQKLESLMYDKFFLKLESTQVCSRYFHSSLSTSLICRLKPQLVIGDNLDSCLAALSSDETDERELHLLERINIDFSVQISIVSDAVNLPRFKVSGKLPTLSMNLSNVKYKRLMRIVDIAIPRFGDGKEQAKAVAVPELVNKQDALRLQGGLFGGQEAPEYNVEDDDSTVVEEPTKEDKATGVVASATEASVVSTPCVS